jgi:hypothetical protein
MQEWESGRSRVLWGGGCLEVCRWGEECNGEQNFLKTAEVSTPRLILSNKNTLADFNLLGLTSHEHRVVGRNVVSSFLLSSLD